MDDSPFMPTNEALVSIGKSHLDHVQLLIGSELKIGWEVLLSQQGNYDWKTRFQLRDHFIDRAGYDDGSTIKRSEHLQEEYVDRICNRFYQVASPPASSRVSS